MMQNRFQNTLKNEVWTSKLDVKIDPKWGVWGIIWGGRGRHVGPILEVWASCGSQVRLGRRFGRPLGDSRSQDGSNLKPDMVPSWSQNGMKIDAKID